MQTLDHKQFADMFGTNDNAVVINVLDHEMYHNEHIPGSINIPLQSLDFLDQVKKVANAADPVVVYCGSKECPASEQAAQRLEEAGFGKVYDFAGGMAEWKQAGRQVDSDIPAGTPKEEAARTGGELYTDDEEEDSATGGCCGGGCH